MYPYETTYQVPGIRIPGTYHTTATAVPVLGSNTTYCHCFLRLLAAAVVKVCTGQGLARARSVVSLSTPGYGHGVFCIGTF